MIVYEADARARLSPKRRAVDLALFIEELTGKSTIEASRIAAKNFGQKAETVRRRMYLERAKQAKTM